MNKIRGLERLNVVIWSCIAVYGLVGLIVELRETYPSDQKAFLSGVFLIGSFIGWKVVKWVISGFFDLEEKDKLEIKNELIGNEKNKNLNKKIEVIKILLFVVIVFLTAIGCSFYSELVSALVLFAGLTAAIRMSIIVYKGGGAFD
jgi:hypothetical protein